MPPYVEDDEVGLALRQHGKDHTAFLSARQVANLLHGQVVLDAKLAQVGPAP